MMIPGANLLATARRLIYPQTISYYQATGTALNAINQYVPTYAAPILIKGSFQPVPREMYVKFNLDLQKSYWTFYSDQNIIDIQRDVSSDQIQFNSQTYQCLSSNDWFAVDGWKGVLCVLVQGQAQ